MTGREVTGSEEKPAKKEDSFWTVIAPVLAAVGTGIGVLGFVIFFGGFIAWSKFKAAGLPANEAVARIPRNDLVVTGASFLVPAVLAALAAVTVATIFWGVLIDNPRRRRIAEAKERLAQATAYVSSLQSRIDRHQRRVETFGAEIHGVRGLTVEEITGGESRDEILRRYDEAATERESAEDELAQLNDQMLNAEEEVSHAKTELELAPSNGREWPLKVAIGGIPMLLAEIIVIGMAFSGVPLPEVGVLIVVAVFTIALAIAILSMTNFGWYAVSVFVGVGVLIAASTYVRTTENPKVSPAVVLDSTEPVAGFFVAETSDAIYLARPVPRAGGDNEIDRKLVTLVHIPKKTVRFLTVGQLNGDYVAHRRSIELAIALCDRLETRQDKTKPVLCNRRSHDDLRTNLASLPES